MYDKVLRYIEKINQWRKRRISNSNFLILAAAVVGVFGGIASSILKELTHFVASFLQRDVHGEYKYYLYLFFPLIGIILTVTYIRTFIRRSKFQHGIPPVLYNISHNSSKLDFHNIYSQVITSALTVGLGGSAGLEAPAVVSGASIGSNIGRFFGLNYRETSMLLACGAAAGIAGAFNSPVAGMIFAMEVIMPEFSIPAFIPLLIASAFSSVVSQVIYHEPLFIFVAKGDWALKAIGYYLIFGIIVGIYSVYFSRLNAYLFRALGKIKKSYPKAIVGGITLGIMIALIPALYGEGYITIQELLDGHYQTLLANSFFSKYQDIAWILLCFGAITIIGKSFACIITMGSGGNGGMFGPSVVVGGLIGFVFAYGLNQTGMVHLNITNFIIAGMAASLSGVMHAPLTGIFLAAEITGGYALIVPLMIVSAISYFINKGILKYSIYTMALAQHGDLSSGNKEQTLLRRIKLKYLIEKDFVILKPDDTPRSRSYDIIHTTRNIFPVVNDEGELKGLIFSDRLLELLVSSNADDQMRTMKEIAQPPDKVISIHTPMYEVMQIMDSLDFRVLPVVDLSHKYLGFVTKNGIFNKYRHILKRQEQEF